jgi:hypothetical protein
VSSLKRELGPILIESLGIFVLAFFGSDLLFAQEVPGVGVPTLLFTSLAIAIGFLVYRIDEAIAADAPETSNQTLSGVNVSHAAGSPER